jgi:hypothetical protein
MVDGGGGGGGDDGSSFLLWSCFITIQGWQTDAALIPLRVYSM